MEVGQQLWWVWTEKRRGDNKYVTVTKIGRKWVYVDKGYRLDPLTMRVDGEGYTSPATCYLSKEEYEKKRDLEAAWNGLRSRLRDAWAAPKGVTKEDVLQAARLLRLTDQR